MVNQMRSEWIKLRSVRSNIILFICAIILCVLFAGLAQIASEGDQPIDNAFFGLLIAQVFFVVIGVQIIGQEQRFGTIKTTFATTPNRIKVLVAKLLVLVLAISVTAIILMGIATLVAMWALSIQGYGIDFAAENTVRFLISVYFISIFSAMFGYGVGLIVKNAIAGIVCGILWMAVVENLVGLIFSLMKIEIFKWLPFASMLSSGSPDPSSDYLSPVWALAYSGTVFLALIAIGSAIVIKRDA